MASYGHLKVDDRKKLLRERGASLKGKKKDLVERQAVFAACRLAQSIYAGARDAALQAAQWARALAARLACAPPPAHLRQREQIFAGKVV